MTNRQRRSRAQGMTLVELMIVVVIISILAAIATVGYKRYVGRARLSEAHAMLAELSAKEQLYFMEVGAYVPVRKWNEDPLTKPSPNENSTAFLPFPADTTDPTFESARTAHDVPTSSPEADPWNRIGLRPRWKQLYCTYLVNAGDADQAPPAASIGSSLWTPATPMVPWFYAVAACNLSTGDGDIAPAGLPANATFLVLTYDSPGMRMINDGH